MGHVTELKDHDFETEVLKADGPVLVDFWAPWCGPCRQIAPMLEELAAENRGTAKILKLNVDEQQATAQSYDVNSIPTLVLFKDGQVVDRFVGLLPKSRLQEALDAAKA